jgi:hypothetical protein
MSAPEANEPASSPEDDRDEGKDRAAAGAARFLRKNVRTVLALLVVAVVGYAALSRPGGRGGDNGSEGSSSASSETTTVTSPTAGSSDGTGGSASTAPTTAAGPATTLTPPDADTDRPAIDLTTTPPATDRIEVARWWGATYIAYSGAEPPAKLVDRLSAFTTPELLAQLRQLPLAASYDAPLAVDGVSAIELAPGAAGGPPGNKQVRVSVETPEALVIYDLTLVPGRSGGWLVGEATRV